MGKITYPDAVSIFKLIFYPPGLLCSIYVAWKHGFSKSSGWIFLTIFCTLRIIGAGAQVATIDNTNDNTAVTISIVCSVMGLSPLLLASLGLLSRAFYSMLKQPWNTIFSFLILKIVQVPAGIALILCIVGATNVNNAVQIYSQTTVKAGIIIFAVVYAALVLLDVCAIAVRRATRRGESLLIIAVALALPFLAVRVIYSLLALFSGDTKFNPITGSNTVALFMDTLMECAVVLIYLFAGFNLSTVPPEEHGSAGSTLAYRFGRGDFGGGRLGLLSLGAAIIQALAGHKDAAQQPMNNKPPMSYAEYRTAEV